MAYQFQYFLHLAREALRWLIWKFACWRYVGHPCDVLSGENKTLLLKGMIRDIRVSQLDRLEALVVDDLLGTMHIPLSRIRWSSDHNLFVSEDES